MTPTMIDVPARTHLAPRGAEPLANAAFALMDIVRSAGFALLNGLRSRHLLAQAAGDAPSDRVVCKDGIGTIKG